MKNVFKLKFKKADIKVLNKKLEVVETYTCVAELLQLSKNEDAENVEINGCVLLGWDEVYDFV